MVQCLFSNTVGQRGETYSISQSKQTQERHTHNRWSDTHFNTQLIPWNEIRKLWRKQYPCLCVCVLGKLEFSFMFVQISLTSSSLSGSTAFLSFFFVLSSSFFFLSLSGRMSSSQAKSCCEKIRSSNFRTTSRPRIYAQRKVSKSLYNHVPVSQHAQALLLNTHDFPASYISTWLQWKMSISLQKYKVNNQLNTEVQQLILFYAPLTHQMVETWNQLEKLHYKLYEKGQALSKNTWLVSGPICL